MGIFGGWDLHGFFFDDKSLSLELRESGLCFGFIGWIY